MSNAQEAFVNPALITWAIQRARATPDRVAKQINVKADRIASWENGEERPTLAQARSLAYTLHVPFGYLFLPKPPKERMPLPDLRTISGSPADAPSLEFTDLLYEVIRKQQWYREFLWEQKTSPLSFVGKFGASIPFAIIAADIRDTLGITNSLRAESSSWEEFLRKVIRNAENVGILVFRSSIVGSAGKRKLSVKEFRGFAISDDLAPLVFINGRDSKAAQIFTFAHELCHIWIGASGISNPDFSRPSYQQSNNIERLCNRVAAEVLMPQVELLADWRDDRSIENNVEALARRYRVSTVAVLRQAYELKILDKPEYQECLEIEISKQLDREGVKRGGGDFYTLFFSRNSRRMTRALLGATFEGKVLYREAAQLLGVRVRTLEKIVGKLFETGTT